MCGIFCFVTHRQLDSKDDSKEEARIEQYSNTIRHRGPDHSIFCKYAPKKFESSRVLDSKTQTFPKTNLQVTTYFGFHRLSVVDKTSHANQPLYAGQHNELVLICNGEIYNYKELIQTFQLNPKTTSDCEVIVLMYEKFGIDVVMQNIVGEFAFVLLDQSNTTKIIMGRDPVGVRRMQYAFTDKNELIVASEPIAFVGLAAKGKVFDMAPGHICHVRFSALMFPGGVPLNPPRITKNLPDVMSNENEPTPLLTWTRYFLPNLMLKLGVDHFQEFKNATTIKESVHFDTSGLEHLPVSRKIHDFIWDAMRLMMVADQPVGTFLSGGFDSSLITSIAKKINPNVKCFSIGLKGSVDVKHAIEVAKFLDIPKHNHHVYECTIDEAIAVIPDVIRVLGTCDITTIRASVWQYLLSKRVAQDTNIKVLLSGEGSDELFAGYRYSKDAPDADALFYDAVRLVLNLSRFDCLRSDGAVSCHGLEMRAPFLYRPLVEYVLTSMPKKYRLYTKQGLGKYILRLAFQKDTSVSSVASDTNQNDTKETNNKQSFGTCEYLPVKILMRPKEAFSDAVSSQDVSWYKSIQHWTNTTISDHDFQKKTKEYAKCKDVSHLAPKTKEALYYRETYETIYGPLTQYVIPEFWMPRFQNSQTLALQDPSATVLPTF